MNIIRSLIASVCVILISPVVLAAQSAVALNPLQGDKAVTVDKEQAFTGTCGTGTIRVMSVQYVEGNYFRNDLDGGIIVRGEHQQELLLNTNNSGISDISRVACVATGKGPRLLITNRCMGNNPACETASFIVVDPASAKVIVPKDIAKDECDEKCAAAVVGRNNVHQLN